MHLILYIGLPVLQSSVLSIFDAFMVLVFWFYDGCSALWKETLSTQAVFGFFSFFFFYHTSSGLIFKKCLICKFYKSRLIWHSKSLWVRVQCQDLGLWSRNLNWNRKSKEFLFISWLTAGAAWLFTLRSQCISNGIIL